MSSFDLAVCFRLEDFAAYLRWYSLAFKDKHPSKADEKMYRKVQVLYDDLEIEEKEEKLQDE